MKTKRNEEETFGRSPVRGQEILAQRERVNPQGLEKACRTAPVPLTQSQGLSLSSVAVSMSLRRLEPMGNGRPVSLKGP